MTELRKKVKKNLKKIYLRLMEPYYTVFFVSFLLYLRSSIIFWQISLCNMAKESYRHVEHACFFPFLKNSIYLGG